jgi:hypothetical protein
MGFGGVSERQRQELLDPLRPNPKTDEARPSFTDFAANYGHWSARAFA